MTQWKVMLTASLGAVILAGCTSTTSVPSGKMPVLVSRYDQTVTIDWQDLHSGLASQVGPLLAASAGADRLVVISYTLSPAEAALEEVLSYVLAHTGPTDVVKVKRDVLAHRGVSVTIRDVKQSSYSWYHTQAVSDNYAHATTRNLQQQAANPQDLSQSRSLEAPNPQAAVGAVDRYQRGAVRPFGNVSMEAGGGKSQ